MRRRRMPSNSTSMLDGLSQGVQHGRGISERNFNQTRFFKSFLRQLQNYGFSRVHRGGTSGEVYTHKNFVREQRNLFLLMGRDRHPPFVPITPKLSRHDSLPTPLASYMESVVLCPIVQNRTNRKTNRLFLSQNLPDTTVFLHHFQAT
jgi:hypothetical protein